MWYRGKSKYTESHNNRVSQEKYVKAEETEKEGNLDKEKDASDTEIFEEDDDDDIIEGEDSEEDNGNCEEQRGKDSEREKNRSVEGKVCSSE